MTIPLWSASIATRGLWKTLRCGLAWLFGIALIFGVGWKVYRVEQLRKTAIEASERAKEASDRAKRFAAGASIATDARDAMDQVQFTVNLPAEESARRMEAKANASPDPSAGRPDPDIVRQLEEAEARVSAAGRRLQRKDSR